MTAPDTEPNTENDGAPTGAEGNEEGAADETQGEGAAGQPESDELTSASAPTSPTKPAGPPAPEGHALVDVPTEVAAKLPPETTVSMAPNKSLVASVSRFGGVHHIVTRIGGEFHHLVAEVERYFGETFGG